MPDIKRSIIYASIILFEYTQLAVTIVRLHLWLDRCDYSSALFYSYRMLFPPIYKFGMSPLIFYGGCFSLCACSLLLILVREFKFPEASKIALSWEREHNRAFKHSTQCRASSIQFRFARRKRMRPVTS